MSDLAMGSVTAGSEGSLLDQPVVRFLDGLGPDFLGYRMAELLPMRLVDLVHPGDFGRLLDLAQEGSINTGRTVIAALRLRNVRASWCWTELRLTQPERHGLRSTRIELHDATERHAREQQMQSSGLFDPRTGLPGPELFAERVASAEIWAASEGSILGLVLLGVASHRQTPSRGAAAWEAAIDRLAERIVLGARVGDSAGHVGPEALGILCEGFQTADDLSVVCERLGGVAGMTFVVGGTTTTLPVVVGGATSAGEPVGASLLTRAERALEVACQAGSGSIRYFEPEMLPSGEGAQRAAGALSVIS